MSLVNLANICSHLQNASRARLGITSIPFTNLHLGLCHGLQRAGFISTVTIGGHSAPPLSPLLAHPPLTRDSQHENVPEHYEAEPFPGDISNYYGGPPGEASTSLHPTPLESRGEEAIAPLVTAENIASRRLWLGMKYWKNEPVLRKMSLISKPTRRVWMNTGQLGRLMRGQPFGYVQGMTQIGECIFVTTDRGILECREAVDRGVGGMLLCRAH